MPDRWEPFWDGIRKEWFSSFSAIALGAMISKFMGNRPSAARLRWTSEKARGLVGDHVREGLLGGGWETGSHLVSTNTDLYQGSPEGEPAFHKLLSPDGVQISSVWRLH